ncbi:uncharacterized protein LOC116264015 [Nymphaea colorata]|nr:uncharacterized protein LOC116264015 [Nymphaea colorata]
MRTKGGQSVAASGQFACTNLRRFLDCMTPVVPTRCLPKATFKNPNRLWQPWEGDDIEYFTLGDLWNTYSEWSAYGAGTQVVLDNEETVFQYYVPYLSAIQIYIDWSSVEDSCSDEGDTGNIWMVKGMDYLSGKKNGSFWHGKEKLGFLYFQYFETASPYGRIPLVDKINAFSRSHPGLKSLKSVDVLPASWMAVSWYPIYHIPSNRTVRDLSTCFLTYHTLSSSFQEKEADDPMRKVEDSERMMPLPPFGLATYKMQGRVWNDPESTDQEHIISMLSAAASWLKQLGVQHHDFNYFMGLRQYS